MGAIRCCLVVFAIGLSSWQSEFAIADEALALKAAVGKVDITPEPGLRLWGYGNRATPATGTAEPLMARALVLESGDLRAAIITLDLGRTPDDPLLEQLRERTTATCGVDKLFVTASHTHQAPTLESYDGEPNEYAQQVVDQLVQLVARCAEQLQPVRMKVGTTTADFAHNRRRYLPDGRVAMQWRNAGREATREVDREVTVVRVDRMDGSPLGVLYHYACHPVVLGPDNLQYSPDFVGAACGYIDEKLSTVSLFLQGACGDINPYLDKTPVSEGGLEETRKMGQELGELVVEAAREAESVPGGTAPLRWEQQTIPLQVRWDMQRPEVRRMFSQAYGARFDRYLAPQLVDGEIDATLTTLILGDEVALVGMPGEVFVQFQLDLKQQSPIAKTLLVGYTNGYHAYFPTIRDAALGGYGGKTATYVAVGSGERLTDEALISLYRLSGKLHEVPQASDFELLEWEALSEEVQGTAK